MLDLWGFVNTRHDQAHPFVRLRFIYSGDSDLVSIGLVLERLSELRNHADYVVSTPGRRFASDAQTRKAIADADRAIELLDRIDADAATPSFGHPGDSGRDRLSSEGHREPAFRHARAA